MPGGEPRKRVMPLVPEPFPKVTTSRQSVFSGSRSMADKWCKFCPNLNIGQYRESLDDKKKTGLDQRATKLNRRAVCNQVYKASEFCWEVSAWNDVFGLLYNDERFLMDKRPYEFLEIDNGKEVVKIRIPDATIGLKSYNDFLLESGYVYGEEDSEDHSTMQPDKRLSKHDLTTMMNDPECGLVVDGVWGKTELLFPFAVYEAKKRAEHYEQAEDQIHHACKTYLAMLDDLARNPDNVTEYQTEESSKYQLFAFASCGSYWQVFAVWNMRHDCMVETIWEGDVKDFSRAFDLICIVDQIQDYAVNHHRPFVMNHLEAWHARHQRTPEPIKKVVDETNTATTDMDTAHEDSEMGDSDSDNSDSGSNDFDILAELFRAADIKPAEWLRLKVQSQSARQEMANETRKRNRSLLEIAQAPESAKEPQKTRSPGRPRKVGVANDEVPKRGRGRPPKMTNKIIKKPGRKQAKAAAVNDD